MEKLVYFELNNWFSGRDYPNEEPFISWIKTNKFSDNDWCKENKLVVLVGNIDMSVNWCVTATEEWVKNNCPRLLTDAIVNYDMITHTCDKSGKFVDIRTTHKRKFSDFLRYPDENDDNNVYGKFDWHFPEYEEENFGVHWYEMEDY